MFSTCARCSSRSRIAAASTSPPHAKTVRSEDLNRRRQLVNLAVALLAMCPVALQPVEALWRWLREDVTYHHCHASADDLTRRVADFESRLNRDPFVIAHRLWVKHQLDPEEEKLRFSK